VRAGAKQADWVVVSLHNHTEGESPDMPVEFGIGCAHGWLDGGAHAFLGGGPHWCWPVEIYKANPILYCLGNFVMQLEAFGRVPQYPYDYLDLGYQATTADFYSALTVGGNGGYATPPRKWRAVFSVSHWEERRLQEVHLYGIDLCQYLPRSQRGALLLADAKAGGEILEKVQEISRPFGTRIEVANGIPIVRI
jgi:hypothetical protein